VKVKRKEILAGNVPHGSIEQNIMASVCYVQSSVQQHQSYSKPEVIVKSNGSGNGVSLLVRAVSCHRLMSMGLKVFEMS
jgi:hypothetical protein